MTSPPGEARPEPGEAVRRAFPAPWPNRGNRPRNRVSSEKRTPGKIIFRLKISCGQLDDHGISSAPSGHNPSEPEHVVSESPERPRRR